MPTLTHSGQLVEACKRGEHDAFREVFETYRNKVYSVALRFSGEPAAAMDIAQDTFLKLYSTIHQFRGESCLETWIYRLVVNSCLDYKRRARRLLPLADAVLHTLRASGDALRDILRVELCGSVRQAVDHLPDDLRIAVILRYTEALSYQEIAEVLRIKPGTVASRLNRAHTLLERRLSHLKGTSHV